MCVWFIWDPMGARRGHQIPRGWNCCWWGATDVDAELESSVGAVQSLNHWASLSSLFKPFFLSPLYYLLQFSRVILEYCLICSFCSSHSCFLCFVTACLLLAQCLFPRIYQIAFHFLASDGSFPWPLSTCCEFLLCRQGSFIWFLFLRSGQYIWFIILSSVWRCLFQWVLFSPLFLSYLIFL